MGLSRQTQNITTRINIFLALNLVDYALTAVLIKRGLGFEGNPLLNWMPFWEIGIVKIVMMYLVARYLRNRITLMTILNLGMGVVIIWNLGWLILLV